MVKIMLCRYIRTMAAITLEAYKEDLSKSGNVLVFIGTEINCLNCKFCDMPT